MSKWMVACASASALVLCASAPESQAVTLTVHLNSSFPEYADNAWTAQDSSPSVATSGQSASDGNAASVVVDDSNPLSQPFIIEGLDDWVTGSFDALALTTGMTGVFANITVVNNGDFDLPFTMTMTGLAGKDFTGPTDLTGSIAINVVDTVASGDGATVSGNGIAPVYTASINNAPVGTLLDPNFVLSAGPLLSASSDPAMFSEIGTGPSILSTDELSITTTLIVSAHDSVQIATTFVITPEPQTIFLLLASGGLAMSRRRKAA